MLLLCVIETSLQFTLFTLRTVVLPTVGLHAGDVFELGVSFPLSVLYPVVGRTCSA